MKSVLISIKHKYCELIKYGKKTIEVRKSKPKLQTPFKCYIYECLGKRLYNDYFDNEGCGKVIGEFVCDNVDAIAYAENGHIHIKEKGTCLSIQDLTEYYEGSKLYGWHISNLKIYAEPKYLREFMVVDKNRLKACPYRERIYQNPEYCNGNYLLGGYSCSKVKEPDFDDIDFCKGGCPDVFKPLTRPPQSWCYVEVEE